jgi:hypothetical protein
MTDRDERAGGFEAEAARRYRQAAETLGPEIRSALRRARAGAQAQRPDAGVRWVPLTATVAAGAIVAAVLVFRGPEAVGPPPATAAEDLELLLDGEEFDLLAELDFYLWLETQADVG